MAFINVGMLGIATMIDMENERILTVAEACSHPLVKRAGKGKSLNRATLWRWATKGVRSRRGGPPIRLETAFVGPGTRVTSAEALKRFIDAVSRDRIGEDAEPARPVPRTPKQRGKASEGARKRLAAGGFCPA
jgi:hypothetical protein